MELHPVDPQKLTPEIFSVFGTNNARLTARTAAAYSAL